MPKSVKTVKQNYMYTSLDVEPDCYLLLNCSSLKIFKNFSIQMSLASNPWPASFETSDEVSLLDYLIYHGFYKIFH